ncbi:thiamine phosphate synthase [Bacillus marasmi]|uniref:thiamine phosphate synthase n=1 Tax=Bacillus marasmi TaxID=1926279 RepID=UPI0011CB5B74|nr:thiamine phosphate synthase [Bacillus marasmi]
MSRLSRERIIELLPLYFIAGSINCPKSPGEVVAEAISGGVTLFQFREKGNGALTGSEKKALAIELQQICQAHNVPFLINDDVDLALELDADGVHIGQEDESVESVRARIGDKILGVSAHTIEEAELAISQGADYLGIGPVYPTKTKEDAREAAGFTLIQELRNMGNPIPIVGIGGINRENCAAVVAAGANGVSVISAISNAPNVTEAAQQINAAIKGKS